MTTFDRAVFDGSVFDVGGFSFLQFAASSPGATSTPSLAFGSTVAKDSLIAVILRLGDTTTDISSISDTVGTAYSQVIAPQAQTTDGHRLLMWKGLRTPSSGPNTVAVVLSAVPGSCRMVIVEYAADGTQTQDTQRSGQQDGTTTPNTGGNLTPAQDNELLIAAVSMGNAPSVAGSGSFTIREDDGDGFKIGVADWIQTTKTPTDAGLTLGASDNCAVILAAFKMAAGDGGDGGAAPTLMGQAIF